MKHNPSVQRIHALLRDLAVGWLFHGIDQIPIDLREIRPIEEVAIRLQGGLDYRPNVFPDHVEVLVSDDGKTFHRVDDFRFWRLGDGTRFGVPKETGEPWVHNLRFRGLETRGRYVGLRVRGPSIYSDEVQVFAGDHDPGQATFAPQDQSLFTFSTPYVYPLRDTILVRRDFASPCRFGAVLSSPEPTQIRFAVDVPEGVTAAAAPSSGICGDGPGARIPGAERIRLEDGCTRYVLRAMISPDSACMGKHKGRPFAHVYMTTDWPAGKRGELRDGLETQGQLAYTRTVPLEAVTIGPVPRSEKLLTQIGPWGNWTQLAAHWPGFLGPYGPLGRELFPVACFAPHVSRRA